MTHISKKTLLAQIDQAMLADRHVLRRQLQQLDNPRGHTKAAGKGKKTRAQPSIESIQQRLHSSCELAQQRLRNLPTPEFDQSLPIAQKWQEIAQTIKDNQVVIIAGETGSGKTTQLPKICLALGRGVYGTIGHTQPRRLAARSVAARIAEELSSPLGEHVGFQIRFSDQSNERSYIKLMTDGILLAEIQRDRYLNKYDTIIIDEAHERSLNIDFLLGYLKIILPKRPDLKVIITSATIDLERFSTHFDDAPVIEVSGRTFPVEVNYRPLLELDESESKLDSDQRMQQGIVQALEEIEEIDRKRKQNSGDVLVFLSGEREIRETAKSLRDVNLKNTEVVPLYARLSAAEQNKIFKPHSGRRVILSTNVAETSLTVPGIVYVIDTGLARISRYSYRSKVQRLPIEPVSQASANQRMGRCGRVRDGVCYRLYAEDDFNTRPEFTDPEIVRTNLAAVILQMLKLGFGEIEKFPFVDMPDSRYIRDGFRLLQELGAVDKQLAITRVGQQLSQLPVDPRIGRMIIEAVKQGALQEVLVIASGLSLQDPRERPAEKKQHADQMHKELACEDSDFLSFYQLWAYYEEKRQELSQGQLRKLCKQRFLSFMRMREWRDLHRQLLLACRQLKFEVSSKEASYESVHRSLLAGLLSHIGVKDDEGSYLGARNRTFHIFPGSSLAKKRPKWVMSSELVETSKLFARVSAKIEPQWIESLGADLLKRNYFEPRWEKKRAQVMAYEQVLLYGLIIVPKRRIDYSRIDAVQARSLFIRGALVEGEFTTKAAFFKHNLALMDEVEGLEAKSRRRDILIDPETLYQFYDERVPAQIVNGAGFERWRKDVEQDQPKLLHVSMEYLMQHDARHVTEAQFPDVLHCEGLQLPLSYHFAPGETDDGVSLLVPVGLLAKLPRARLEWLVPGMLEDKCTALIRALPKQLRKNFVPVPDYVQALLQRISPSNESLLAAMSHQLKRISGVEIPLEAWSSDLLDDHYRMNLRVVDEEGDLLGQGRDALALQAKFAERSRESIAQANDNGFERKDIRSWDFSELPERISQDQGGVSIEAYPALIDEGASVSLKLCTNPQWAAQQSRQGVLRLLYINLARMLKENERQLKSLPKIILLAGGRMDKKSIVEDLWLCAIERCFLEGDEIPRDEEGFKALLSKRGALLDKALEVEKLMLSIFERLNKVGKQLKGKILFDRAISMSDVKAQQARLIYKGFAHQTPWSWLQQYPRYFDAMLNRLERMGANLNRDRAHVEELNGLWQLYEQRREQFLAHSHVDEEIVLYRWMLEEYRVSLFAQTLKTILPISDKRLRKQWAQVAAL